MSEATDNQCNTATPPLQGDIAINHPLPVLDTATLLQFKEEKDLIKFQDPHPATFWGSVCHVNWSHILQFQSATDPDMLLMYKGLQKIFQVVSLATKEEKGSGIYNLVSKRLVICPTCYNCPTKPLMASIILCRATSNIKQHCKIVHKGKEIPEVSLISSRNLSKNVLDRKKDDPTTTKGGMMTRYTQQPPLQCPQAKEATHQAIFCCINDLGFPTNTVEKEPFRELLECIMENADFLSNLDFILSHKSITSMRTSSFKQFVLLISKLDQNIRNHYQKLCGKQIEFASICHDIWNGIKKDTLGVWIMFVDPCNCAIYKIPIGLMCTKGHTTEDVLNLTKALLLTYGFASMNLCASINNNTNGAILVGKYITDLEVGGKHNMHKAELSLIHSTGIAVRKH